MSKALFIDCCLRGNDSRTKELANAFFETFNGYEIETLVLENEDLRPLVGDYLDSRQILLDKKQLDHPRFRYAHQFSNADIIIVAAPFWDLSFPALFKIYIENISVDGITFSSTSEGLKGLCKAKELVYLTTRGGFYNDNDPLEQALPYLKALIPFFGLGHLDSVAADGMDIEGFDSKSSLEEAKSKARKLGKELSI